MSCKQLSIKTLKNVKNLTKKIKKLNFKQQSRVLFKELNYNIKNDKTEVVFQ